MNLARQLVDPQTGEPAVDRVAQTLKLFGGGPPEILPDIFVEWKPSSHLVDRLVHPKEELTQKTPEFFRGSHHTSYGFFAATGPSVLGLGAVDDVSPLDMAPTFLSILDESIPNNLTGNIIKGMITDQSHFPRPIHRI